MHDPASRPVLEQELEASKDVAVLQGLAFALGRVGDRGSIRALRAKMQSKIDGEARAACEDAIREIELQEKLKAQRDQAGE